MAVALGLISLSQTIPFRKVSTSPHLMDIFEQRTEAFFKPIPITFLY